MALKMARINYVWVFLAAHLSHIVLLATAAAIRGNEGIVERSAEKAKRPALSFNQDLQSLADMISDGRASHAQSHLMSLGKRGPPLSFNQDLQSIADMLGHDGATNARNHLLSLGKRGDLYGNLDEAEILEEEKRAPALSFNQDLHSIADMLEQGRMSSAQNQLLALGKRSRPLSFNQDLHSIMDMLDTDRASASRTQLHRLGKRGTLSINQDLQNIADYVRSGQDAEQPRIRAQGLLHRLGKRSEGEDRSDIATAFPPATRSMQSLDRVRRFDKQFPRWPRGAPLSVSLSLASLSQMLDDQRQEHARHRLMGIGK